MIRHRLAALASAVARAIETLRAARHVETVADPILELLGQSACSDQATFWTVDTQLRQLRAIARWSAPGFPARSLAAVPRHRMAASGDGHAEHVWRSRKPLWSASLVRDLSRPRAAQAGLCGGVWFAVKTDTIVYGVIELFGHAQEPSAPDNLVDFERLGVRLGHALEESRHGTAHRQLRWQ